MGDARRRNASGARPRDGRDRHAAPILRGGQAARLTIAGRVRWPGGEAEIREAISERGWRDAVRLARSSRKRTRRRCTARAMCCCTRSSRPVPDRADRGAGVRRAGNRLASGGMPELVGEDGGELLPVEVSWEDAKYPLAREMAAAVRAVMSAWRSSSEAARRRAESMFDHHDWVERHRMIFERLLA